MSGTIVWFQLDLRLDDQPALAFAAATGEPVIPVYCLDDVRAGRWAVGGASRWWLHQSLCALSRSLEAKGSRLILRRGDAVKELMALAKESGATAIAYNRRYEPWAAELEVALKAAAQSRSISLHRFQSSLMFNPDEIRTGGDLAYKVFTPFWKTCRALPSPEQPRPAPRKLVPPKFWPRSLALAKLKLMPDKAWISGLAAEWTPGEAGAAAHLRSFLKRSVGAYGKGRDLPAVPGTSRLSPHLHFGELSPRRAWHALETRLKGESKPFRGNAEKFRAELGWREFGYHILANFPRTAEEPLRTEFKKFPWRSNHGQLRAWQRGRTGYPLIDAGMRQLWATGWMHNRVRMNVSSFLVKHLRQHWLRGTEWFWETLVDADLASNTLGWQWSAGCGADAAPYFRIFNPVLQGEKFDSKGDYVRRWVPELKNLSSEFIHQPWAASPDALRNAGIILGVNYPQPIVDHATARAEALAALKSFNAKRTALNRSSMHQ
ncbi:MAG: DNA photolyase family protein [Planctomycetes bacterium]|nr:DNA photolyase family protein [Planctomycetota bacterium]